MKLFRSHPRNIFQIWMVKKKKKKKFYWPGGPVENQLLWPELARPPQKCVRASGHIANVKPWAGNLYYGWLSYRGARRFVHYFCVWCYMRLRYWRLLVEPFHYPFNLTFMNCYCRTGILTISKLSANINSARYIQRIIQTVKSREGDNFSRPDKCYHYTGTQI